MSEKWVFLFSFLVVLVGPSCASKRARVLGEAERLQLGLTGVIYEARLCPHVNDPVSERQKLVGDCELVSCERRSERIVCTAVEVSKYPR